MGGAQHNQRLRGCKPGRRLKSAGFSRHGLALRKTSVLTVAHLNQRDRPMRRLTCLTALLGGLSLSLSALAADIDASHYGFPIADPFEATITTAPPALRPKVPASTEIRQADYSLDMQPERMAKLPDTFWAVRELKYRLAEQPGEAPLIFIIAGTGADYSDSKPEFLKQLFYGAGYHVVQLSSPTSFDFIASASSNATPGISPADAEDLYRVMEAVSAQHPELKVSEYLLTGYSLGAVDAAFVSHLDEQRKRFNFKRVLMLNPAVNLVTSVSNLDKLTQVELPGVGHHNTFFDELFSQLTRYFKEQGRISVSESTLFKLQNSKERLSPEQMAMLIGASFRFSVADIVYTSDLINQRGLVTPPGTPIGYGTNLTPYFKKSVACDFNCYIRQQVLPYWQTKNPGGTYEQLNQQVSLYAIQDYLRNSPKIAVMTNADDIILGPGDIGFLRQTFGDRLTLYPLGGHCGNLNYRVNTDAMLEFFRG